jgi:peptidoglycan/xylan/chitin deacetylase (PgdA/CDA1 family)
MAREQLIRLSLRALAALRVSRWLPDDRDAAGVVLTLHHVQPASDAAFQPNALLSVTPEFLDSILRRFKAAGWRFVPVDELLQARRGGGRLMAVTLDDGYRNNLQHALPVFRRNAVPFTIYVCPGFCDRTAELWWEALERIIAAAGSVRLEGGGPPQLRTETILEKQQAFRTWVAWLTREADEGRQREAIRALADRYGLDLATLARDLVMDWDEVRSIAAEPLCSIGAHTMTHPALARLPAEHAMREMLESAERIDHEIGVRPTTIAFPYGYRAAAGPREAGLAQEASFAGSFTTRPGTVPAAGARHGLPRMSLNGLFQDPALMEALVTPGLWKLKIRLRPA